MLLAGREGLCLLRGRPHWRSRLALFLPDSLHSPTIREPVGCSSVPFLLPTVDCEALMEQAVSISRCVLRTDPRKGGMNSSELERIQINPETKPPVSWEPQLDLV